MSPSPSPRRLLTQLECAKGGRGSATGDSKPPASAKGPDGVVLYELHSRPEQEKFNESAKVKCGGAVEGSRVSVMDVLVKGENAHLFFCFSRERDVRMLNERDERLPACVWVFVRVLSGTLLSLPAACCLVVSL